MKAQKHAAAEAVTARPRSIRQDALDDSVEEGLSTEPEEMGKSFLRYATQQGAGGPDRMPELRADGAPAGDGSLSGSHFSSEASIWENTAGLIAELGDADQVTDEAQPASPDDASEDGELPRGVLEVDLTESVIDEASLLDEESSVLGETVPKHSRTDDGEPARSQDDEEGD